MRGKFQHQTTIYFRRTCINPNGLHKTSKGMREMTYQYTQQFERATMLQLQIQPLLVLCGVSGCPYLIIHLKT
mgnify:CR=1 FL=1